MGGQCSTPAIENVSNDDMPFRSALQERGSSLIRRDETLQPRRLGAHFEKAWRQASNHHQGCSGGHGGACEERSYDSCQHRPQVFLADKLLGDVIGASLVLTVATQSRAQKQVIMDYLIKTGTDVPSLPNKLPAPLKLINVGYQLNDFGCRGVSSMETASIEGSDTMPGLCTAIDYYKLPLAACMGTSIPAAEHSTITSWGRAWLQWSLTPTTSTMPARSFRELPPQVRVIQGDGISYESLKTILEAVEKAGWAACNVAFGSGGALLQKMDRDTQKCAFKCCEIVVDGKARPVFKDPISDQGKKSKQGRLKLVRQGGTMTTLTDGQGEANQDLLVEVFRDGKIVKQWDFGEIREYAEQGLPCRIFDVSPA
eukprot:TRINITY_DN6218_c0_g1_i2.p1 TRINITY_DN6218_c0_g1~~TRINITY_DN6218_c0_g1_i2.p1  ORF type:complete len:393 (+),score=62.03 TRINITY_DN6218_c0_g1_i2:70-1179(+)